MDDYIDSFIASPKWPKTTASSMSSWNGTVVAERNSLLSGSLEHYGDEETLSTCMLPSNGIIGRPAHDDSNLHLNNGASSVLLDGDLRYRDDKSLCTNPRLSQHKLCIETTTANLMSSDNHSPNYSLQGATGIVPTAGSFEKAMSHGTLTNSNSTESNSSEPSAFPQGHGDAHSVPTIWPSSFSSLSSYKGHGNLPALGFQEAETLVDMLRKPYLENGKFANLNSLPASLPVKDKNELYKPQFSSFFLEHQKSLPTESFPPQEEQNRLHFPISYSGAQIVCSNTAGLMSSQQLLQSSNRHAISNQTNRSSGTQLQAAQANISNGTFKPRVRARRGQATDPHSIAERLRREKIADRMKNLQELVPNSNKTDKASMLDEIIDYAKFLQLQVKVLSMSRLGGAGAVVPLLADIQRPHTEGSRGLLTSSAADGGKNDVFESEDNLAFEQEVVKLMETNVTSAMQYLQNKGLCLMPIALATAISSQKGSSTSSPADQRRSDVQVAAAPNSYHYTEFSGAGSGANDCKGTVIKQEETLRRFSNGRDSVPKLK